MNLIRTNSSLPAAVLWDMDGTIVDTEPYWMLAETELVASFGGTWTHEDCMQMVGNGLEKSAEILQGAGVDMEIDAIVTLLTNRVQEQLNSHGLPWRPGALELLTALSAAGVPMALVTMSLKRMAQQIADKITEQLGESPFATIVAGDMVTDPKPHPEAYLLAADILGVDPVHCIAIEDSVPGLAAAVSAGTIAIGVPHQIALASADDYILWASLAGRGLDDLAELYHDRIGSLDSNHSETITSRPTAHELEDVSRA
ncbi:HAD superfamily hydrolase (TIGR01509 family) [Leifsonia psychrotolerans]|uniref:HAD superfamily hydrolase (TIGR01509 family) n=2 Tax=Glaciibacter psychrotolerans TaxID=670054 RepID=A0A7Z0EE88_9MICO|nr:HAD superfamily hydrolase (TIGR01509 family) [Leifsonia psychrotolerans]